MVFERGPVTVTQGGGQKNRFSDPYDFCTILEWQTVISLAICGIISTSCTSFLFWKKVEKRRGGCECVCVCVGGGGGGGEGIRY